MLKPGLWWKLFNRQHGRHRARPVRFSPIATEEDVYFCYRLILGREPDPNGFDGYLTIIRSRPVMVHELAEMFFTSPEFKNLQAARGAGQTYKSVELDGFRMYVSEDDWSVGRHIAAKRVHEPHVTLVIRRALRPDMTFLDIGANIGYYTLLAASLVGPGGRVFAFEPNPANVSLLHLSTHTNGFDNVEIFPFALADAARLFLLDSQGSNAITTPLERVAEGIASRSLIRSVVLDEVLNLDRLDVIKIDVEGAEAMAVRGAARHIQRCRPAVFSEFSPPALGNISRVSGEEYLAWWFSAGYSAAVISAANGELLPCGQDTARVMREFAGAKPSCAAVSHIDLLLSPLE